MFSDSSNTMPALLIHLFMQIKDGHHKREYFTNYHICSTNHDKIINKMSWHIIEYANVICFGISSIQNHYYSRQC